MKGFFFLSLVGAAIYAALLVSHGYLPSDRAAHQVFALRSWGSGLPALASPSSEPSRQPMATRPVQGSQSSTQPGGLAESQARTTFPRSAARHTCRPNQPRSPLPQECTADHTFLRRSSASVPVVPHCKSSTEKTAGFRLPVPGEEGWVLEKYLTDLTSVTPTAMETETSKSLKESMQTKAVASANKRARTPRPVRRDSESVALVQLDKRSERRAEGRGGFGLFIFGRFARAQ